MERESLIERDNLVFFPTNKLVEGVDFCVNRNRKGVSGRQDEWPISLCECIPCFIDSWEVEARREGWKGDPIDVVRLNLLWAIEDPCSPEGQGVYALLACESKDPAVQDLKGLLSFAMLYMSVGEKFDKTPIMLRRYRVLNSLGLLRPPSRGNVIDFPNRFGA